MNGSRHEKTYLMSSAHSEQRLLDSVITKVTVYTRPSLLAVSETEHWFDRFTWSRNLEDIFARDVAQTEPGHSKKHK